jgi:hypothetical protein
MGGWRITFEMQWKYKGRSGGVAIFDAAIKGLENAVGDFRPIFEQIADDVFEPRTMARFADEGADVGGWQELAESTVKARTRGPGLRRGKRKGVATLGKLVDVLGFGLPILVESGALMESFTKQGRDHVERIEPKLMEWGSADPIAIFHQTGTGKGFGRSRVETGKGTGRGMAMRKILALGEEDYQAIQSVFTGRLAMEIKRAGWAIGRKAYGNEPVTGAEARQLGEQYAAGGPGADLLSGM